MKTIVDYATKVKEQHALNKTLAPVETDLTDASRAYAIGEQFIYNGELFKAKTAIAQHDALVLNTNYEAADNLATEIEALTNKLNNEIVTRSALGAKNILPFDLAEIKALNTNGTWAGNVYTYRGVAFTVNSDGTISATGTATGGNASIKLFAASSNYEMLGKEVILTGCPSNGSASTYRIQAYRMASADGSTGTYFDDGAGTDAFTVLNDASGTVGSFAVAVYENATVTSLLFKPMVRLASDPDATYQPYAKTNRELTAENQTLTKNVDVLIENGAVNHLPTNAVTQTIDGVTFTVNDDKSVTVSTGSGGATANAVFPLCYNIKIKSGMIFKGCPSDGDVSKYFMAIEETSSPYTRYALDSGEGGEISASSDGNNVAYIRVNSGQILTTPITFKPMIADADYSGGYVPYAMTNKELTEVKTGSYTPAVTSGGTGTCSGTVIWHRIGKLVFIYASNLAITMTSTNTDVVALSLPFDTESNQSIPLYYANSSFFDLSNSVGWVSSAINAFHIMKNGNSVKGSNWGTAAVNIGFAGCYLAK